MSEYRFYDEDDYDSERDEGPLGREGCLYPDKCCMPGPHYESECHTVEMLIQEDNTPVHELVAKWREIAEDCKREAETVNTDEHPRLWSALQGRAEAFTEAAYELERAILHPSFDSGSSAQEPPESSGD